MRSESLPLEYGVFLDWIEAGSSVLDLGCGDGELLSLLVREKKVKAQGIEIDEQAIYRCVARGLSVFHQDIDNGLSEYANKSFDYVILNQSFQQVKKPDIVLTEALRVSEKVIISFPNFAHWPNRLRVASGRMPVTKTLPYQWYDTPNIRVGTYADFEILARKNGLTILDGFGLQQGRPVRRWPNWRASVAVFKFERR